MKKLMIIFECECSKILLIRDRIKKNKMELDINSS